LLPTGLTNLNTDKKGWSLLYNMTGEAFMRSRQLSQADNAFAKAMENDPLSARTWVNLGRVHNIKNEELQAEKAFKRAIELNPRYALAQFHLGMLYLDQGLEDNGFSALKRGLELSPGDPMGSLRLAMIYIKRGRKDLALDTLQTALKHPITNTDLYQSIIRLKATIQETPPQKI
jgi:tetratricopeptide (TPR) repeat protein